VTAAEDRKLNQKHRGLQAARPEGKEKYTPKLPSPRW